MLKKILAAVLAAMMLVTVATSCSDKDKEKDTSSKKPTSSVESVAADTESDIVSSEIAEAEVESEPSSYNEEEDLSYDWTIQTKSAFFRDTDEAKESVSKSETIKQYKNPGTYMIGAFQLHMRWLTAYGTDTKSRAKEFEDVARAGYFNTYLLGADESYLAYELPIIAETGGTFWLGMGSYSSEKTSIETYTANVQRYVDLIKDMGYYELLNGFYWDEPIWNGQKNEDFLAQCKVHYVTFGLRNFPVFATGEFTNYEGNEGDLGLGADQMKKLTKEAAKYITDIAFDAYTTDVREGAKFSQESIDRWEDNTGHVVEIETGMDYYRAFKEWLLKYIGHPANFYYYPCAYLTNVSGGITVTADEAYCTAHAEYMAEDLLNDERGGGIILYNYQSGSKLALEHFLVVNDENGFPTMHTDTEKWEKYSAALKKIREKFDATKQTIQYK